MDRSLTTVSQPAEKLRTLMMYNIRGNSATALWGGVVIDLLWWDVWDRKRRESV